MTRCTAFIFSFLICVTCTCVDAWTSDLHKDKHWQIRQDIGNAVDSKGLEHWRRWRDQHSVLWFLHDWRVKIDDKFNWLHLQVKIYKTPGAAQHKSGEQCVLKIFGERNVLIYTSDKNGDFDSDTMCFGKPLYIVNLDNDKIAIVSSGPGGIRTTVFAYIKHNVNKVLETTSKYYPEFVYPAAPTKDLTFRIITNDILNKNGPTIATVHIWNQSTHSYVKKNIPFSDRFAQ